MSRILVVEDDPAILRGLTDNLRFESYEVLAATDGEAAYRLTHNGNPDLIILDLMLPKLDGYDLCRKLRREGIRTPILILSARAQEEDRVLGLDLGADDYVTKPFSMLELMARIRTTLRHRQDWLEERAHFDEEVRFASEVQHRLFPQSQPSMATLDYAGICLPARGVSGDYYDFLDLGASKLGLVVADVVGKGISAALLTATLHASIHTHAPRLGNRCDEVVSTLNSLLYEATDTDRFATLFYAVYDDAARLLAYVNAGHEPPLVIHSPRTAEPPSFELLDCATLPVGIIQTLQARTSTLRLVPGDWLAIFSDGLTEAFNEAQEEFGRQRLLEVIIRNRELSVIAMRGAILSAVKSHCGAQPQGDDQTLVLARVF